MKANWKDGIDFKTLLGSQFHIQVLARSTHGVMCGESEFDDCPQKSEHLADAENALKELNTDD